MKTIETLCKEISTLSQQVTHMKPYHALNLTLRLEFERTLDTLVAKTKELCELLEERDEVKRRLYDPSEYEDYENRNGN